MFKYLILFLLPLSLFAIAGGRLVQTTVSITTTASAALVERLGRSYLLVVNKGSDTVYLKVDSAPGAGEGIPIPAGGNYEIMYPPSNTVYLKAASGTQSVEITEG